MYLVSAILLFCVSARFVGGSFVNKAWTSAVKTTMFEQEVEDVNSMHRIDNHLVRRLIVMPLNDAFNPNQANGMHGKVQYGDKCSLPGSIGTLIFEKPYEVPWLFEVKPVNRAKTLEEKIAQTEDSKGKVSEITRGLGDSENSVEEEEEEELADLDPENLPDSTLPAVKVLDKAYISPLDFRAPENYIFMPQVSESLIFRVFENL